MERDVGHEQLRSLADCFNIAFAQPTDHLHRVNHHQHHQLDRKTSTVCNFLCTSVVFGQPTQVWTSQVSQLVKSQVEIQHTEQVLPRKLWNNNYLWDVLCVKSLLLVTSKGLFNNTSVGTVKVPQFCRLLTKIWSILVLRVQIALSAAERVSIFLPSLPHSCCRIIPSLN